MDDDRGAAPGACSLGPGLHQRLPARRALCYRYLRSLRSGTTGKTTFRTAVPGGSRCCACRTAARERIPV